jgi:hypothetical protein
MLEACVILIFSSVQEPKNDTGPVEHLWAEKLKYILQRHCGQIFLWRLSKKSYNEHKKKYTLMDSKTNISITNRKAFHDYELVEEHEAGIELFGWEVKSIRNGSCQLK